MKISEFTTKSFLGGAGAAANSYILVNYEDNSTSSPVTYKASLQEIGKAIANDLGLCKKTANGVVTTTTSQGAYVDGTAEKLVTAAEKTAIGNLPSDPIVTYTNGLKYGSSTVPFLFTINPSDAGAVSYKTATGSTVTVIPRGTTAVAYDSAHGLRDANGMIPNIVIHDSTQAGSSVGYYATSDSDSWEAVSTGSGSGGSAQNPYVVEVGYDTLKYMTMNDSGEVLVMDSQGTSSTLGRAVLCKESEGEYYLVTANDSTINVSGDPFGVMMSDVECRYMAMDSSGNAWIETGGAVLALGLPVFYSATRNTFMYYTGSSMMDIDMSQGASNE